MVNIGDMTRQNEATILPSNKVVFISRDLTLATGTQAVTGVGFRPSSVLFISTKSDYSTPFSVGIDDGAVSRGIYHMQGASVDFWTDDLTDAIRFEQTTGVDYYEGRVSSFDADGFTLSWTKTGTTTLSGYVLALAFK